jgi:hypothetical protein
MQKDPIGLIERNSSAVYLCVMEDTVGAMVVKSLFMYYHNRIYQKNRRK